jgi:hypothetical protein
MSRTRYLDNALAPEVHIQHSPGGEIFSLICSSLSLLWWCSSPRGSLGREFAEAPLLGHSVILPGLFRNQKQVGGSLVLCGLAGIETGSGCLK